MKIIFIFTIFFYCTEAFAQKKVVNMYDEPKKFPNHTIYHETGKRFKMSDFTGNFTIAIFWSKSCSVCVKELDDINNFYNMVKDNGVNVILVSPSGDWNTIAQTRKFLDRYRAPDMEVYWDEDGKVAASLGIFATPHNVLINSKGQEIGRIRGGADWDSDKVIEYIYKLKAKHG